MRIQLSGVDFPEITIRDLVKAYTDNDEEGVVGYDGKLNIRPKYQRNFVYSDKQRDEVIRTVKKSFPLNTMYWIKTDDDNFELMDGQQRTVSVCQYVSGDFSVIFPEDPGMPRGFDAGLTEEEREEILNYKLSVYVCEGEDKEKLDWFKIINIAGEKLSDQEMRNAMYTGTWLTDAKRWFSKSGAPAKIIGEKYLTDDLNRQGYLERALYWLIDCPKDKDEVAGYMSDHQNDQNAQPLWDYFQAVVEWVEKTFPNYNKIMKGVEWGELYNKNKGRQLDPQNLAVKIKELLENEAVDNQKYIYEFVLIENPKVGDDRKLSKRGFPDSIRQTKYAQQQGECAICGEHFELEQMHSDHIMPWSKGGRTNIENCQMLCTEDNLRKAAQTL
jgi:hypothetical protein